jgi:hypothetical protein
MFALPPTLLDCTKKLGATRGFPTVTPIIAAVTPESVIFVTNGPQPLPNLGPLVRTCGFGDPTGLMGSVCGLVGSLLRLAATNLDVSRRSFGS